MYKGENNDDMETNGELQFMRRILPQCKIVFDVGANIGDWTALALNINPHLQVHCFEPSVATFQRLQTRDFGGGAVTCNNLGLSSAAGETTLYVFSKGSGTNSLYRRQGLEDGFGLTTQQYEETIRLNTLDAYCQHVGVEVIDFLKVDVEGHELEVFKGATEMLTQGNIKRIQFEYGGCNIDARVLLKDLFEFFEPYGYTFYKIYPRDLRRVPRYDQGLENFQYQNWAVVANDISP
jgi:FkbM family methyltransferase